MSPLMMDDINPRELSNDPEWKRGDMLHWFAKFGNAFFKRSTSAFLSFPSHPQVLVGGPEAAVEAGCEAGLGRDVGPAPGGVHEGARHEARAGHLLRLMVCPWKCGNGNRERLIYALYPSFDMQNA